MSTAVRRAPRTAIPRVAVAAVVAASIVAVAAWTVAPSAIAGAGEPYHAITPTRVLDTRDGTGTTGPGQTVALQPIAIHPPADAVGAAAIVVDLAVTEASADGFATAYPCGQPVPIASNLNFHQGATVANLVIATPGADGDVCVVTNVATHLVADLQGWLAPGSYLPLAAPERILDTRTTPGHRLAPGVDTVIVAPATGAGMDAVVVNVTAVTPDRAGYVTVHPCGTTPPLAANLNVAEGDVAGNLVIARPGADGSVCARANVGTDLVVDLQGRLPAGSGLTAISPVRMADTRSPIGVPVAARLQPGVPVELSLPVISGIPAVADAAVMNVAATDAIAAAFVTVYACGQPPPLAANLNVAAHETRSNLVVANLGTGGTVCVVANAAVHVVIDLQGWLPTTDPIPPVSPRRRVHVDVDIDGGNLLGYLAYLPAGYDSNPGRTWPTMVFLHGSGQRGTGSGASLDSVAFNGIALLEEQGNEPAAADGFIVLVPQIPDGTHTPTRLHAWLTQVLSHYAVDRDRLYLTGLSLGGFGAFDYVGTYGDAGEFAAVVPIAGGFSGPIRCDAWRHVPLWAFHGEVDPQVNIAGAIRTVDTVDATCAPTERAKLTTYPGVGHNSYDRTYDLSGMAPGQTNPSRDPYDVDIYTWMLSHVRSTTR